MYRWLKYLLLALLWSAVVAYIVYAGTVARRERARRTVERLEIRIADSTSHGNLVSERMVRQWIRQSGLPILGTAVDSVQLAALERLIARNGFVSRADAYVTYSGELTITIGQRDPLVRLLTEGIDSYATCEGYVFAVPPASSLYVPVVTGSYRPPFTASHDGTARAAVDAQRAKIDQRIVFLDSLRRNCYKRERANDRAAGEMSKKYITRRWWRLESAAEFDKRVAKLRKEKTAARRRYRYIGRTIKEESEQIVQQIAAERDKQKKLEKSYEDFMNLLTFVESVERDDFWRSEVVQIVAHTTPSGALEVDLVPRSGSYTILFGRLERVNEKFETLQRFYDRTLPKVGWGEYRTIDIRYKDRVVCRK